jgi:perosamine synthetase
MFDSTVRFIRKLYGTEEFIPLHAPRFLGNEKKYLNECIDSTFVSSVGKFVDRFEEMTTAFTGTKKAVVCVNGTNGLHLALMLLGTERDDEVLTQALTFIATCNAISYIGAYPVFIDVDRETMGLSPESLENWLKQNAEITSGGECRNKVTGRRIKACVPMHTFGHPARIDGIVEICDRYHIEVVEDAAESIGSYYKGKHTGTFAKIGVLSFNGNKTLTTGGGGMMLFNDEDMGKYAKHLTTQAKVPHRWEFVHDQIGYNYRMPNINAALGCAQMEYLESMLVDKRDTAEKYNSFFAGSEMNFVVEPVNSRSNYWLNCVLLKDKETRNRFLQYTNDNGVMTRPAWCLMNRLNMFKDCQHDSLENSSWIEERLVNIPSSVKL